MNGSQPRPALRYDRTVRAVMWLDAFLSAAVAALCIVASPVVVLVGLPRSVGAAVGVAAIACAAVLAACGAVTAVLLAARLAGGEYLLPTGLRLPLPSAMRPPLDDARAGRT